LAEYERAARLCHLTEPALHTALFGAAPALFGHVAATTDGELLGFALWFLNFSTWDGRHGIYLEDLYVRPAARGRGAGRALLTTLAGICLDRGYTRLQWWVLDWNDDALRFYRRLGAEPMDEWTVWRLSGQGLAAVGGRAVGAPPSPYAGQD
jgi:GNAT superfamily N-acetyltransferase